MRKKTIPVLILLFSVVLAGCMKDKVLNTYWVYKPIYKDKAEVLANIKSGLPAAIEKPGKIFLYGNYIFLNEVDKGIHVIDNSNPSSPIVKSFINIPGNLDLAVKGNTLYADLYSDMVVVDISNPVQATLVKHIANIFPERNYTNGFIADSSRFIVGWKKKDTTVRLDDLCNRCDFLLASPAQMSSGGPTLGVGGGAPAGIAGSMARFSIVNDFLYTVNGRKLTSFNISNPNQPLQTASQHVGGNIETIFPFKNKLFIGSMSGMFIYDITNPASPVAQGQFNHARACDPVISDGDYAYVTLRTGRACPGITNQMDVVDVRNVIAPVLVKTYAMTSPQGLSKEDKVLFVCDGSAGLKMYDATDPLNLVLKKQITELETYDAIAYNGNLIVVAKDGLYQYGYSYPSTLQEKSKILLKR